MKLKEFRIKLIKFNLGLAVSDLEEHDDGLYLSSGCLDQ